MEIRLCLGFFLIGIVVGDFVWFKIGDSNSVEMVIEENCFILRLRFVEMNEGKGRLWFIGLCDIDRNVM